MALDYSSDVRIETRQQWAGWLECCISLYGRLTFFVSFFFSGGFVYFEISEAARLEILANYNLLRNANPSQFAVTTMDGLLWLGWLRQNKSARPYDAVNAVTSVQSRRHPSSPHISNERNRSIAFAFWMPPYTSPSTQLEKEKNALGQSLYT